MHAVAIAASLWNRLLTPAMLRVSLVSLALLVPLALTACDSGPSEEEQKAAEAAAKKKQEEEDALAKRKAEREAKDKAAEDAKEEERKKLDALAVIPEGMEEPKDIAAACDAVAEAQDAMMQKYLPEDKKEGWNSGKEAQLGLTKAQCNKTGSMKIAMCQANALNTVPEDLYKKFNDLVTMCAEKYKEGAEGEEAAPAEGEAE